MKAVLIYYSFTGHTHKIAQLIMQALKAKGHTVTPVRIRPLEEEKRFVFQCRNAFLRKKPELYNTLTDLSEYDTVIVGSPVWAFTYVPAFYSYFEKVSGLSGKKGYCIATYGSGAGKDKALKEMADALRSKGADVVKSDCFQQHEDSQVSKEKINRLF